MAVVATRNAGMLVLALWLILHGLMSFLLIAIPPAVPGALALVAGVLILLGR
jgi:hypothetical protein